MGSDCLFLGFQTSYENRSVTPRWDSHDFLSLWWLLQGALRSSKRGRPNVAIHDWCTVCSSEQAVLAKSDSVTKPKQRNEDTSASRGWRHALVRGSLVDGDVHHDSGFSLITWMHEESGALRDV